jgi:hypothetical protein
MQRTVSLLLPTLVAALLLTGCPEKKVEKEEPAAPTAVDKAADKGDEKEKAAAEDEHGEDPEGAEDPKAEHKAAPKKKKAADEKDQGGW